MKTPLLSLALALMLPLTVRADGFEIHTVNADGSEPTQIYIGNGNVKIVSDDEVMVFLGKSETMLFGDTSNMTMMRMNEKTMKQMATMMALNAPDPQQMNEMNSQIAEAMKELEKTLERLPEEQREMARKMLQEGMPQGAMTGSPGNSQQAGRQTTKLTQTNQKQNFNGKPCVLYEITQGGTVVGGLWATDWKHFGLDANSFEPMQHMSRTILKMMNALPSIASDIDDSDMMVIFENLDRCPMVIREIENGKVIDEILTKLVKKVELSNADFDMKEFKEKNPFSMQ